MNDPLLPCVSVLLSTHNRAPTLATAIESVLAQREVTLELLVVNDHSSDGTAMLLEQWADDARVQVHHNQENLGLARSLNWALEQSRGMFIARIDDDDEWTDRYKLKKQLHWLRERPQAVLLGTAYLDEWGRHVCNPLSDHDIRQQLLKRCPFCHPTVVLRKEAALKVGGYNADLAYGEDWDLWLRLGRIGELGNLADETVVKRELDETLSKRFFYDQLRTANEMVRRYGGDYPGALRAHVLHGLSRLFFTLVPVDSGLHQIVRKCYQSVFSLASRQP